MVRKPIKRTGPERRKKDRRKDRRSFAEKALGLSLTHDRRHGGGRRKTDKYR